MITEILSEMILNTWDYIREFWKSTLTILLLGTITYVVGNWYLSLFEYSWIETLAFVTTTRLILGPPVIHYEPPLDAEERRILVRNQVFEEGQPLLHVVPDDSVD